MTHPGRHAHAAQAHRAALAAAATLRQAEARLDASPDSAQAFEAALHAHREAVNASRAAEQASEATEDARAIAQAQRATDRIEAEDADTTDLGWHRIRAERAHRRTAARHEQASR